MDISGEQRIEASREAVWAALNDPEILRRCIPGCQSLEKLSETEMKAVAVIKVGPVSARFQGAVTLTDLDPPNGYRILGEGQGGVAGFAKGDAAVRLVPDGTATVLHYTVAAQIGGKLAQLGGRLIDATARKMSDAFFRQFAQEIARQDEAASPAPQAATAPAQERAQPVPAQARPAPTAEPTAGLHLGLWINTAALVMTVLLLAWLIAGSRLAAPEAALPPAVLQLGLFAVVMAFGYGLGLYHGALRARLRA